MRLSNNGFQGARYRTSLKQDVEIIDDGKQ